MSTTEITPTSAVPLTVENIEYRVYTKLDAEGNPVKNTDGEIIRELRAQVQKDPDFKKYETANTKEDGSKMEMEATVTVSKPKFGSLDAFIKYFEDDSDLMMYIINLGVSSRFNAVVPKELLDANEDGSLSFPFASTSVLDPRELLTKEVQRRNLSPVEKATRDLKKLTSAGVSPAELIAMLQALQASQS